MTSSNDPIVLYGGQGDIFASLKLSDDTMPYLMCETAEFGIEFGHSGDYDLIRNLLIMRLHAFGEGGDLLIRRDESKVFWRFIGKQAVYNALSLSNGKKYTCDGQETLQKGDDECSLLWGKYDEEDKKAKRNERYEARMGKAKLNYPDVPLDWNRVEIHAWQVLDAKKEIVAYWTYKLAPHPEKSQNQPQESQ